MEQPLLRLGLLGFPEDVGLRLQALATEEHEGWPLWRCCDPHLADAWMINGSAVEVMGRDELVIAHPFGSDKRLTLHRAEVDRPLAFAQPLPEGFASAEFFDATSERSVRLRLQRFEAWLRPLRTQFALGAAVAGRSDSTRGVFHLVNDGKLLAIVDFVRWQAGISVPARPGELSLANWVEQPVTGVEISSSFIRLPMHRVMWTYAVRTSFDVLPERYRTHTIYLRRVPLVPAHWFAPEHLALMQSLAEKQATFDDLLERTGFDPGELAHHLAALFHAGGLTTDPESARRAEQLTRRAMAQLDVDEEESDSDLGNRMRSSDQIAPTTVLRESRHSPLRVAGRTSDRA